MPPRQKPVRTKKPTRRKKTPAVTGGSVRSQESVITERRPGTEVWLVAQEHAWDATARGLPPRRGSQ